MKERLPLSPVKPDPFRLGEDMHYHRLFDPCLRGAGLQDQKLQGGAERTPLIVPLNCVRRYGFGTTARKPNL